METRDSEIKIPGKEDIPSPDRAAMEKCQSRWLSIAKPLFGLGTLEDAVTQMAGMTGTADVSIDKKGLIVMCADNGVVEEGISQTDSSVTAVVTDNFSRGLTSACIMSRAAGVDVFPIDIGVAADTKVYTDKIAYGTKNMLKEPAMTREEAEGSILAGIRAAKRLKKEGYQILLTGEMGIGNTTTSSAVASVLLGEDPERLSGRGAGLSDAGLQRKREVIRRAIGLWKPDPADPVDVLAKVGGFDIGGLAGVFLGGAMGRLPVVMGGFISAAVSSLLLLNIIGHYRLKKLGVHKLAGVACFKSFVFKKLYKSFCKGFINKNKIFLLRFAFAQIYYRVYVICANLRRGINRQHSFFHLFRHNNVNDILDDFHVVENII